GGVFSPSTAQAWLDDFKLSMQVQRWTDELALDIIRQKLKGAARKWFDLFRADFVDLNTFETEFTSTFIAEDNEIDKYERMRQRVQGTHENLLEYIFDKIQLCNALKLKFATIREQVCI